MKRLVLRLLSPVVLLMGVGCTYPSEEAKRAGSAPRYHLYLYANNRSLLDSLALVEIVVDDSTLLKEHVAYSALSSNNLVDSTTIGGGQHRVQVAFGRFRVDTVVTISHHTSLLASMAYETRYPANNGLAVITVVRDGEGGID